jgi:hypothetical protein
MAKTKEFRLHGTSKIQAELISATEKDVLAFRENQRLTIITISNAGKLVSYGLYNPFSVGIDQTKFNELVKFINT